MIGSGQRLGEAIQRDPRYDTVEMFAESIHKKGGTVRQQINRDSIPAKDANLYCRNLKCDLDWLLYGRGKPPWEAAGTPNNGNGEYKERGMKNTSLEDAVELADALLEDFSYRDVLTILKTVAFRRKQEQTRTGKAANPIQRI